MTLPRTALSRRLAAGTLALGLLAAPLSTAAPAAVAADNFAAGAAHSGDATYVKTIFDDSNQARLRNGRTPLSWSSQLGSDSLQWSQHLARTGTFEHTTKNVRGNLYTCSGCTTPTGAVEAWLKSPGHRRNLLNTRATSMGIGIAQNTKGEWIVTQRFNA